MATTIHKNFAAAEVHVPGYIQSGDPGAVGAGKLWLDTTTSPAVIKKRNSGDTGWDLVGGSTSPSFVSAAKWGTD